MLQNFIRFMKIVPTYFYVEEICKAVKFFFKKR